MGCVIGRIHYGLILVVLCFTHFTASHYHHFARHRHWTHVNACGGVTNMLLVLLIIFYFHYKIWGCMCSPCPFQFRWLKGYIYNSCYYHHQIGSIHLSYYYHIFPWLCTWDVYYIIFCHVLHIYIYIHSRKNRILFSLLLHSLWWVQIIIYVLACRSYSFVHYSISLS